MLIAIVSALTPRRRSAGAPPGPSPPGGGVGEGADRRRPPRFRFRLHPARRLARRPRASRRRAEAGFVLVATLWALAALAVLAAYIDGVVASDVRDAIEARRSLQAEIDRRSTEATVLYLLATGRMNHRGLVLEEVQQFADALGEDEFLPPHGDGELEANGAVYAGLGGARFALQDEGGLVSVNAPRSGHFQALLAHAGLTASEIERIVARVEDYIDSDDTLTMGGAERYDYRRQGEPPPLNWIMSSPLELRRVLGVDEAIPPERWRALRPLLTMRPVYSYNFNTMRPEVLALLLGLDERGVRRLVEEREKTPILRLGQVALLSGRHLDIDEMELRTLPSRFVRVSVWHEGDGSRILTGIALTPLGESAPWQMDYRYREPVPPPTGSSTPREPPLQAETVLLR